MKSVFGLNEERLWLGGAAHEAVEERKLVGAAPVRQRRIGLSRRRAQLSLWALKAVATLSGAQRSACEAWRSTKFPGDTSEILAEHRIGATCDDCQRWRETARRQVAVNSARPS